MISTLMKTTAAAAALLSFLVPIESFSTPSEKFEFYCERQDPARGLVSVGGTRTKTGGYGWNGIEADFAVGIINEGLAREVARWLKETNQGLQSSAEEDVVGFLNSESCHMLGANIPEAQCWAQKTERTEALLRDKNREVIGSTRFPVSILPRQTRAGLTVTVNVDGGSEMIINPPGSVPPYKVIYKEGFKRQFRFKKSECSGVREFFTDRQ